jgi:lipopolysaccharide transport system permease protein
MSWSTLFWLIPALALQVPLCVGLGLILATVHVFLRDTAQGVSMVLSGWFYLTPIVYPIQLVPESFRRWLDLNPLTALVGLYRAAFLGAPLPEGERSRGWPRCRSSRWRWASPAFAGSARFPDEI